MRVAEDPRVERTRELVLGHVRELVRAEGFAAVTPQRVASDTGVSRSTLHRHWPDVRSLIIEAIADPGPIVDTPLLGDLRLDLGVDLHQLRLKLAEPQTQAMVVSIMGQSVFDPGFAELLREHLDVHLDRLRRVLATGQATGELRADIDLRAASAMLAGPLFFRKLFYGEDITAEFVVAVVDGFIAANSPRPPA
jgi:AcrR family transcriptional regulator